MKPMSKLTKRVGDLLKESYVLLKKDFITFSTIIGYVFAAAIMSVIGFGIMSLGESSVVFFTLGLLIGVIGIVGVIILGLWSQVALIEAADHSANSKKYKLRGVFAKDTWSLIIQLIITAIFFLWIVMLGVYPLVVPGVMFAIWLILYKYTVVLDRKRDVQALYQSYKYVRGRFWPTLWRFFALSIIINLLIWVSLGVVFGLSYGIRYALGLTTIPTNILMGLFCIVIFFVVVPYALLYSVLVYRDLKKTA